jgi:class 3 adenylate cyclase
MEGRRERKVVTVLFADLVGFTARAEQLDPEDVEAILRPYHERLRGQLERFGGTVEAAQDPQSLAVFITHARLLIAEGRNEEALKLVNESLQTGFLPYNVVLRAARELVSAGRRAEADEQLRRALAFYRMVGATRYVREGEALLAASA